MELHHFFPYSNTEGSSMVGLKTQQMQQIAANNPPLTNTELENIISQHHLFLQSGGAGGRWKTLSVSGFIFAIYTGVEATAGEQAVFEKKNISKKLDLQEVLLPFSNFCAVHCINQDFSEADLSHSLMTDAMLNYTIFADANLSNVDFSRASLRNVSFMNTNLRGADFENCDLTGADFRGAILDGSRFPGAILKDVIYK